ncbi:MAG: oligosaccharide flippase family protein [Verrucomicrobiota bacterium]|jgi:O-antigen/teichoic acid export membrane protein
MSRLKRAIHGVASSYVLLAATALYSLASIPVALYYLDKERFGLWALMSSLVGYLSLIDAGMSGSAARLIIDHKDDRDGGHYGSLIKTGWLVFLVQGAIILVAGLVFANSFARLLAIPTELQSEFIHLVYLQCGVVALSFATRVFSLILSAHQRMDLVNYTGILSLMVNFAALWLFFHFGFGVLSLAWAALCATVTVVVCQWLACEVFKLFPGRGGWGRASWSSFKEIFAFGKDVFLVSVGTQFIMASQIIVITRMLGLEAAAIWSVGLRVFSLVSQVIWRISDMSGPAFAEMMVRGETSRLRERYATVAVLTASLSGFAAISFALCNSLFIPVWTHGKIQWPMTNNLLLGIWMILLAVLHCHNTFVLLTKKVGLMRYVYFVEGVVFVSLSILVARRGGLPAIIACSIVCSAMFSGAYGVRRISRYFNLPLGEVGWNWFRPMGRMLLFYLPVAVLVWWLPGSLPGIVRLAFNAALAVSVGGYFLLRYGIPLSFQDELLGRVPARFGSLLKHIFVQPAK